MKGSLRGIWPFVLLFAAALLLRFYNIGYPFSVNGIDEGNDLMAGKLAATGFSMYSQINTMQAPLFLYVYSLLDGNIVACRSLSAVFSVLGILGVCLISRRIANNGVALVSGVFVAFNFYFLKEARLASMDLFASVLLIWGFFFLTRFIQGEDHGRANLFVSGCLFAVASMTKLFAVIPTMGVSIYLATLWLRGRGMSEQETGVSFLSLCVHQEGKQPQVEGKRRSSSLPGGIQTGYGRQKNQRDC